MICCSRGLVLLLAAAICIRYVHNDFVVDGHGMQSHKQRSKNKNYYIGAIACVCAGLHFENIVWKMIHKRVW